MQENDMVENLNNSKQFLSLGMISYIKSKMKKYNEKSNQESIKLKHKMQAIIRTNSKKNSILYNNFLQGFNGDNDLEFEYFQALKNSEHPPYFINTNKKFCYKSIIKWSEEYHDEYFCLEIRKKLKFFA